MEEGKKVEAKFVLALLEAQFIRSGQTISKVTLPRVTRPMELANGADTLWIGRPADLLLDLRRGIQGLKS